MNEVDSRLRTPQPSSLVKTIDKIIDNNNNKKVDVVGEQTQILKDINPITQATLTELSF